MEQLTIEEKKWLLGVLQKIGFFDICSVDDMTFLLDMLVKKNYEKGSVIIKENTPGDFFFIIAEGSVGIYIEKDKKPSKINQLSSPGDFFGETALLTGMNRTATVIAETDCVLYMLYRNEFLKLMKKNPQLEIKILKTVEKRLKDHEIFFSDVQDSQRQTVIKKVKEILNKKQHNQT